MTMQIRRADARGRFKIDWLDSHHSFSFGEYFDPAHMGFGALRVINEDRVAPAGGFPPHPHRDMEIISYVLDGALEHKDSIGTGSVIRPGDVQRMSAGTGIRHSEFNASDEAPVHFLQIWIIPEAEGIAPGYEQKSFDTRVGDGALRLVASRDGRDGSITVHQDVSLFAGKLAAGGRASLSIPTGRRAWVQVARGAVEIGGERLDQGDGAALVDPGTIALTGVTDAEVLVFDLA